MNNLIKVVWKHEIDYLKGKIKIWESNKGEIGELVAELKKEDEIPPLPDLPVWFLENERKKFH